MISRRVEEVGRLLPSTWERSGAEGGEGASEVVDIELSAPWVGAAVTKLERDVEEANAASRTELVETRMATKMEEMNESRRR